MVRVTVTEGLLEGELIENHYGGKYYSFKGIPYAEPPTGELRFKAPQPAKPWEGAYSAKKFGPVCFQTNSTISDEPFGSEDCLYLNVYTPNIKPEIPLPVMLWIHGGGFLWGSGNDDMYGPEFLIRHGVILVTINYRLEVLGFLCLDTEDIPGNAGMKDQVAALRWVNKNINNFGGDPGNITIFGESAGAASVSYHLVSPMTKGLFKRAIVQSGAATCWWSQSFEPRERALALAKKLGLHSEDNKELYEFFKNQPLESLSNVKIPIIQSHKLYEIDFAIANEKEFPGVERFFSGDVVDVFYNKSHENVEVIIGYTEDEGLMAFGSKGNTFEKFVHAGNSFLEFFVPKFITDQCPIREQLKVGREMKKFYVKDNIMKKEDKESLIRFLGMDMFVYGMILQANLCLQSNKKVYLYKFGCKSERNVIAHLLGIGDVVDDRPVTCHADDIPYIFTTQLIPTKVDMKSHTFVMIDRITTLWTNFAKYGNPTPDDSLEVHWNPFTTEEQSYLNISNELTTDEFPDRKDIKFWNKILEEYLPHYSIK